ncbi:hypothetical protein DID88_004747 [Monilinia fructigena]|uniref:Uncharacterized protein n=1 Tax=Monilinia fructigena TaxID=38457 RepID=A0A395IS66_9HELO|nr:hypothetical protein DID88_004747 [Monilinia fructigena]
MGPHGPVLSGIPTGHDHSHPYASYAQDPYTSMAASANPSPAFAPHCLSAWWCGRYTYVWSCITSSTKHFQRGWIVENGSFSVTKQSNEDNFSMGVSGSVQTPLGVTTGEDKIIGDKMFGELTNGDEEPSTSGTKMDHQLIENQLMIRTPLKLRNGMREAITWIYFLMDLD